MSQSAVSPSEGVKKLQKNDKKLSNKLSRIDKKLSKKLSKILKRVGGGEEEEEGDL
jgi:hypothetical protein